MATRENQGLQAVVIILSILTLGLLVGVFVVNNMRKTQFARAEAATASATDAQQKMSAAQQEASELKLLAGFAETDTMDAVREAHKADMDKMGVAPDEESRRLRNVLSRFFDENKKLTLNIAEENAEVKTLSERLLAVESQKDAQVKKLQEEMDKVRQDMADERAKFEAEYARINTANKTIDDEMKELQKSHDDAIAELEKKLQQGENRMATLQLSIDKLRLGVPNPDQFAQPADGMISSVDQRSGVVWVNLGSADGLRPQVTFAVAEAGLEDAAAAEKKGAIEITQILGPHLAEARITEDDATNPLMPKDRIFSQVWDRGRKVGFGIAGFIDLDGDRVSDLEKLKSIIAASGGIVDAAPNEAGQKEGELKVSTRYLILGENPNDPRLNELRTSWNELGSQAEELGVDTIALDEFLSLIGWRNEARSVPLGPTAQARDFPVGPLEQELPRKPGRSAGGDVFKPRLPSTTY
jgi:hypothetical protein